MTRRNGPARNRLARIALLLTGLAVPASAQTNVDHQVLSNGGSSSTGGGLTLHGTVGQVLVGLTDDGSNDHRLGFWEVPKILHTPPVTALNGATQADARPTLDWGDVAGATSYEIEYDDNPGFTSPVIVNVAASTHTFTSDLSDDVYSWRVRALSPLASSIFSATDSYVIAVVVPPPPADLTIPSTSLSFGTVQVGQSSTLGVSVSNVGGVSASATPSLTGANSDRFSLSFSTVTVAGGGTTTLNVTLTPNVAGSVVGTLTMNFGVETLTINLTGTGDLAPAPASLSIGTTSLSFGDVVVGETKTLSISASNSGGLTGSSTPSISGGQSSLFGLSTSTLSVAAGATSSLDITLTPTTEGGITGTLTVNFGGGQLFTISLTGTGVPPLPLAGDLTVVADTLDFGNIVIGETATLVLQVVNAGVNTGLTEPSLDSLDIGFVVTTDELSVAGGATADRDVTFTPEHEGAFFAIVSLDFGVTTLQVVIVGIGILPPPVIEVEQALIDFGIHGRDMPSELSYWFTNTGDSVLEIDTVEVDTSRWTVAVTPLTLAAGDSGLVEITYGVLWRDHSRTRSRLPRTIPQLRCLKLPSRQ